MFNFYKNLYKGGKNLQTKHTFTMKFSKVLILIVTGAVTGTACGLFGGGGGMIVVPMLTILCSLKEKESHATAIAIILPLTVISGVIQILSNNYDLAIGIPTLIGSVLGGVLGGVLLKKINGKWLVKIFAVIMFIAGVKLLIF